MNTELSVALKDNANRLAEITALVEDAFVHGQALTLQLPELAAVYHGLIEVAAWRKAVPTLQPVNSA